MSTSNALLFDTNVLVYNQDQDSDFYQAAAGYHQKALSGEVNGVMAAQNLLEFAAVIINPKRIVKPLSQRVAAAEIKKYSECGFFTFIYPNAETLALFTQLIKKYRLKNPRQCFDLFLVATMLSNGVGTILTVNTKDFEQFREIKVVSLK